MKAKPALTFIIFLFPLACFTQLPPADMKLWLRADRGVYADAFVTSASGNGLVQAWADQSGNNNHFQQPNSLKQPVLIDSVLCNRPALRFDAGRQTFLHSAMRMSGLQSIFIVFINTPVAGNYAHDLLSLKGNSDEFTEVVATNFAGYHPVTFIANLPSSAGGGLFRNSSGINSGFSASGNLLHVSYDGGTHTDPASYAVQYDSLAAAQSNGGVLGRFPDDSTAIGARAPYQNINFLTGDIAEVIVYNRLLSPAEINDVTDYLIIRYGLVGSCGRYDVLPQKLYNFNTTISGRKVHASWEMGDETGVRHYRIQRSGDGYSWGSIALVPLSGGNQSSYSFTDYHPSGGWNYYRIEVAYENGISEYSAVKKVWYEMTAVPEVRLYPNPATDFFAVEVDQPGAFLVTITNITGNVVRKITVSPGQKINIRDMPAGLYQVTVNGKYKTSGFKLVKR